MLRFLFLFLLPAKPFVRGIFIFPTKEIKVGYPEAEGAVDYDSIVPCNTTAGYSGLMCGSSCVANHVWCNPEMLLLGHPPTPQPSCGTFTTLHPLLCQNTTFWSTKTCDYEERGEVLYYGLRCKGEQQHCFYPRQWRFDYGIDDDIWRSSCSDKTDQVIPVDCRTEGRVAAEYCRKFCPDGPDTQDPDAYDDDVDCDDPSDDCSVFTDKETGKTIQKGWECKNLCTPDKLASQDCQYSCAAKYNFTCNISGELHCLHPDLVCNNQQQCDQAEDEECIHA